MVSLFPVSIGAAGGSSNLVKNINVEEVDGANVTKMTLDNDSSEELEVEIVEEQNRTVYESYLDGQFVDRTITYPDSDKMLYEDKHGNSEELSIDDYVTTSNAVEKEEKIIKNDQDDVGSLYNPPPSYSVYHTEYSDAWNAIGYLYGLQEVTTGPTQTIVFSTGTAVSTIIGVIGAIFTGGIGGILLALGASVVGSAIDSAIDGEVYSRTTRYDYEVISQNTLGLRTWVEDIEARVLNAQTGAVEWVDLTTRGDSRSRSDLVHAGIYNVAIGIVE